jgi:hypothetical protein
MAKDFYIDFHSAIINRVVVGSSYKFNQFIAWDGEKTFYIFEFSSQSQSVCQVDRFSLAKSCHVVDAQYYSNSYFADMIKMRACG